MGGRFAFWKVTLGGLIHRCSFSQHGLDISGTTGFLKKRHFSKNKIYFIPVFYMFPVTWLKAWTSGPLHNLYFRMWKPRHSCPGLCVSFSAIQGWCKWHVGWHERSEMASGLQTSKLPSHAWVWLWSLSLLAASMGTFIGFFGCCC